MMSMRGSGEPGGGGGKQDVPRPLEFWQKCGYQTSKWDRFDIAQHLC